MEISAEVEENRNHIPNKIYKEVGKNGYLTFQLPYLYQVYKRVKY